MTLAIWFWIIYVLSLVFSIWSDWPRTPGPAGYGPVGGRLLFYVLIGLLGWQAFGGPVHK